MAPRFQLITRTSIALLLALICVSKSVGETIGELVDNNSFPVMEFLLGKPINSRDLEYSIRLGGRLQVDADYYDGVFNNSGGGDPVGDQFLRRGRLNIGGYATSNWQYRLQVELESEADNNIPDAHVTYKGFGNKYWIKVGKQKVDMGLEWVTSSNAATAIERSVVTQAFSNNRSNGVSVMGRYDDLSYSLALHENDFSEESKPAVTARVVKKQFNERREILQIGGGFSFRKGNSSRIIVRPELREIALENQISSGLVDSDDTLVINLEAMAIRGNWHFSGELYHYADQGADKYNAKGGYATVGYFITGEKHLYDEVQGRFSVVTPFKKSGAWEVFSRLSWIDLADNDQGNTANFITVGTNWYLNSRVRLMFNAIHTQYDKPPDALSDSGVSDFGETRGNAVSARLHLWF